MTVARTRPRCGTGKAGCLTAVLACARLSLAMVLSSAGGAGHAADRCTWHLPSTSDTAAAVPIEVVRRLPDRLTANEIIAALGPAARDVGSGLHVLQWDTSDGQVFSVSVADPCGMPQGRGLQPAPKVRR